MRKTLALMAVAATAAFSAPAMAQTRCSDMLADWQRRVPERTKERAVNQEVERANEALQRGDDRACRQHMQNAFEMVGGRGSARDERYSDRRYDDRRSDERYERRYDDRRYDDRADRRYDDRRYDDRADRRYDDRRYDDRYDDRRRTEGSGGGLGELIERGLGTMGR